MGFASIAVVSAATLLVNACSSGTGPSQPVDGNYRYTATTHAGQPLLKGNLQLAFAADSTVTGVWSINWVPGADQSSEVGPQIGTGTLRGNRSGSIVTLDLTPGATDNNVRLMGRFEEGALSGNWHWDAFTGPRSSGNFTASSR